MDDVTLKISLWFRISVPTSATRSIGIVSPRAVPAHFNGALPYRRLRSFKPTDYRLHVPEKPFPLMPSELLCSEPMLLRVALTCAGSRKVTFVFQVCKGWRHFVYFDFILGEDGVWIFDGTPKIQNLDFFLFYRVSTFLLSCTLFRLQCIYSFNKSYACGHRFFAKIAFHNCQHPFALLRDNRRQWNNRYTYKSISTKKFCEQNMYSLLWIFCSLQSRASETENYDLGIAEQDKFAPSRHRDYSFRIRKIDDLFSVYHIIQGVSEEASYFQQFARKINKLHLFTQRSIQLLRRAHFSDTTYTQNSIPH